MGKIVIAGGSGFLGQALAQFLAKLDHDVVILSRQSDSSIGRSVRWNGVSVGDWAKELEGALAVINLTGKPVATKWTTDAKQEILLSRVQSTKAIAEAIKQCAEPPKVWINASAVGIYGDRAAEELDESSQPGKQREFLVDTCVAWEAAVDDPLIPDQVRRVKLRIGVVLGQGGGAFPMLAKLTRMFLGSHVGSGRQFVPWVHVDDLTRMVVHCIEKDVSGPVKAVS
ncbi:MAG: TIGR01777 family oxidoreductase, partial [Fimbriimonadaceae bacterium]